MEFPTDLIHYLPLTNAFLISTLVAEVLTWKYLWKMYFPMLFCLKHVFRYLRLNKLREKVSFPKKFSHGLAKRADYDEDDKEEDAADGAKNHSRTEVGLVVPQEPPDGF